MSPGFLSKRNVAIGFGVVLVVMVVIVGAAIGVGHPSVPSDDVAVVDANINVPGVVTDGKISKTGFDATFKQTALQAGLQAPPQPSDKEYQTVHTQAVQQVLQFAWITGEAQRQGLTITDTQVQQQLQQIKSQFKTEAEYVTARDQAGLTDADVLERARLSAIQAQIQDKINASAAGVSTSDAQTYYDANKSQFTQPEQRTIRVIQNTDAHQIDLAYQALRADATPANWKKVAAQYSTDPTSKAKGGLRTGVVAGTFQQPLDDDIFKAPLHQVTGPVVTSTGNYVFEVEAITPETTQSFDALKSQIEQQLKSQNQQTALQAFVADFQDYWSNLTTCASGYVVQGCDNFTGGPSCDPSKLAAPTGGAPGAAPEGCPAPVFSTCQESAGQLQCTGPGPSPAAPGTIAPFTSATTGQAQHPHPAGAGTAAAAPTGLPGGIIPGAGG